ncbi:DUF433 domain-containing protein [Dyadobacter sp. CY261]|uniref:DUF433 domain-containing protein n=1 Tax=Dyadobacter sp. CY261 TaxID=2907203 RepID=UPI001F24F74E|nr:DUF433 domain-containing protein [Dyadobacter sp. CY261]MCF0070943.1 DUF433 domain-containing protein [Dyadobacter sp. CY261]
MTRMKNMGISQIVTIDPEILSGQPVFSGTRVAYRGTFRPFGSRRLARLYGAGNALEWVELTKLSPLVRRLLKQKLDSGPVAIYEGMDA